MTRGLSGLVVLTSLVFLAGPGLLAQPVQKAGIPRRVVSLSPIITETLYLLGAEDQLIANTSYCNVPEAARFKEKIGTVLQMNVEKILALKPDLVIASALSREKQLRILEEMAVPVMRAENPKTFEQMCEMTLGLGDRLGREARAHDVVATARRQARAILLATAALDKPRVFLQIGIKPLHSANKEMFINEYIRYAGGVNIAGDAGTGVFSREKVLAEDPDVILVATMGSSKKAAVLERDRWMAHKGLMAVQHNRVHVLDAEMICSPTPISFVAGLRKLLPLLHPGVALARTGQAGD